ncbi:MAG: hypothetical protein K0B07_05170 [DPANN group archaeon]|nr:hypothetical protein [DPANN group archaeon]
MISKKSRKGMGMALTLVVTAVVLIVISLVIITMVTGGLSKFGASNNQQMNDSSAATSDAIAVAYCNAQNDVSGDACCKSKYAGKDCTDIITCGITCPTP